MSFGAQPLPPLDATRWRVQVVALPAEHLRMVGDVLVRLGATLVDDEGSSWIEAPAFASIERADEVREVAGRMLEAVRMAMPDVRALCLGPLVLERLGDAQRKHHFIDVEVGRLTLTAHPVGIVVENPTRLAGRRALRAAVAVQERYQREAARVGAKAEAAYRFEEARRVHRLLAGDLDTTAMHAIGEIIKADVQKLAILGFAAEFDRFNRSINHQDTFGDEARHATSNWVPHPNPMSSDEARAFIRGLAQRWFEYKAADDTV